MITAVTSHIRARTRSIDEMASFIGPNASSATSSDERTTVPAGGAGATPSTSTPVVTERFWKARSWARPTSTNTSGTPASTEVRDVRPTTSSSAGPSCTRSPTENPVERSTTTSPAAPTGRPSTSSAAAIVVCRSASSPPTMTTSALSPGSSLGVIVPRPSTTGRAVGPSSATSATGTAPPDVNGPLIPSGSTQ